MLDDLTPLIDFERSIQYQGSSSSGGIAVRIGEVPVLFSAPHACQHKRAGHWKAEDEYTATIAEWLHRLTGAHAIYITRRIDPDPHDDGDENVYKQTLATFVAEHAIELVVDLHGSRASSPFGVALGTMHGITCPQYETAIIQIFEEAGFLLENAPLERLSINHPKYTGGLTRPTVTRFAHQILGIAAIQIEINSWLRVLERLPQATHNKIAPSFRGDPELFRRVMAALAQIANSFTER
jgi:hypothetical protein